MLTAESPSSAFSMQGSSSASLSIEFPSFSAAAFLSLGQSDAISDFAMSQRANTRAALFRVSTLLSNDSRH